MNQQPQWGIPYPDKALFQKPNNYIDEVFSETKNLRIIDHFEYPESGGIFCYYKGFPYPRKGFPTPDSVATNNILKRLFIDQVKLFANKAFAGFIFLSYKNKIKFIEEWLNDYCFNCELVVMRILAADPNYGDFFLLDDKYNELCRELRKLTETFLTEIGIKQITAFRFAKILTTMIEYDSFYFYLIKDPLTETTKEKLLKNPAKEIKRIVKILGSRMIGRPHVVRKFRNISILLTLALWSPRIRRSFKKSVSEADFKNLQLDEIDMFNMLELAGYNGLGESEEVRMERFRKPYLNQARPMLYKNEP